MLFNCSLLATGLCNLTNTPYEVQGDRPASYQYSKWKISNCSPAQTQTMITILDEMQKFLPSVIQAVERNTETLPYRIFFKNDRELPYIQAVFTKMAEGKDVKAASDSHVLHHTAPEFFCPASSDFTAIYWDYCIDNKLDAVTFKDMGFVILCPMFWDGLYPSQTDLVPMPTCPSIGNDTILSDAEPMLGSKLAIAIHELIHLYMENQIAPEIYSMRACAELNSAKASRNSNNYTFFTMSI